MGFEPRPSIVLNPLMIHKHLKLTVSINTEVRAIFVRTKLAAPRKLHVIDRLLSKFFSSDDFFDGYFPSALFDVSTLRRQRLLDDADDGPVDDLDDGDEADADAETQDTANLENDIAP